MEKPKENKSITPAEDKQVNEQVIKQVRIKMKPGRAAEGVVTDADGFATVDTQMADYLVRIQYADMAEE